MYVLCKKLDDQRKELWWQKDYMILYSGHKSDKHESGTGFYISRHIMDNLIEFELVNEKIWKIMVYVKYYILTLISTHAPIELKDEVAKEEFYSSLERVYDAVPNYKLKTGTRGLKH